MANLFTEQLISPEGVRQRGDALEFDVRLPWYRSLPLSVVELGELRIDGQSVEPSAVSIEVNGKAYAFNALADLVDEWWYVLDNGRVRARGANFPAGSEHDIELTLKLFPPYIPGLVWVTKARKRVTAGAA